MQIDITPLLNGEKSSIEVNYELPLPDEYAVDGVTYTLPCKVIGSVTDTGGYIEMVLKAEAAYHTNCARCLEPVDKLFEVEFKKSVAVKGTLENEDTDDYVLAYNGIVDIDIPLSEQIFLEFPLKVLCSEDCKGLCFKCGKNLNEGNCSCEKREIDPRLAVLKQLLK